MAQLGARRVWDAEVDGSSPSTPTFYLKVGKAIFTFKSRRIFKIIKCDFRGKETGIIKENSHMADSYEDNRPF